MKRMVWIFTIALTLAACSHNPYLEASLKPAELREKTRPGLRKTRAPRWETSRFFGGEKWIYYRIAGGKTSLPLFNFKANECQITLLFDKEDKFSDYSYSGC